MYVVHTQYIYIYMDEPHKPRPRGLRIWGEILGCHILPHNLYDDMSLNVIQFTCGPATQQLAWGIISNTGSQNWRFSVRKMRWQPTKIITGKFEDQNIPSLLHVVRKTLQSFRSRFSGRCSIMKDGRYDVSCMIWKYIDACPTYTSLSDKLKNNSPLFGWFRCCNPYPLVT